MRTLRLFLAAGWMILPVLSAHPGHSGDDPFRQLDEVLPDPNLVRAANGAPGPDYWQQRADYRIEVTLDDAQQRLTGSQVVRYTNNSPQALTYLWVQLDQNRFLDRAPGHQTREAPNFKDVGYRSLNYELLWEKFQGGYRIRAVKDAEGADLPHAIVDTMMRIDLPEPLEPGGVTEFQVAWEFNLVDAKNIWARNGYEFFEEDGNHLYTVAQWYPRMAAFTDVNGWQNKQFLGRGEFALEFGDFEVAITVPADHVVAATGKLQNAEEVLSITQRERLKRAEGSAKPVFIITREEAEANEKSRAEGLKTWVFKAENVRDFAWASSRKFLWDAAQVEIGGRPVWAMSYYPKEGEPLWSKYSTHAVMHALESFSRHTFDYPYPVCISVNGPVFGMEYPMLSFNGPRPEDDGTYSRGTKHALISVIIHEVGHNWFPMIVNSDERQWTWMDEGLCSYVQFLAEQEWAERYPSRSGHATTIVDYMKSGDKVPVMTNSESLVQFGNNAYAKPATALNILRETILGRETFDFAFREYANRWKFKRPMPADFFRTMEDASGVDLDWFWRGWFYSTDHVEIGIGKVVRYEIDSREPDVESGKKRRERAEEEEAWVTNRRNEGMPRYVERFPELRDFYDENDEFTVLEKDREEFEKMLEDLEPLERELLETDRRFYTVQFRNSGGLVMPVILKITYADGTEELERIPAEIWRRNPEQVTRLFITDKDIARLELDPHRETSDVDRSNNSWGSDPVRERFRVRDDEEEPNLMRKAQEEAEDADEDAKTAPTDAAEG